MITKKFLIFLSTIFIFTVACHETLVVHPYRQLDNGSNDDNGFTVNNDKIYLATLFDGHIYEFDISTKKLKDRFRIRAEDRNENSPGGMVYDPETRKLFAATGKSFNRIPNIYIFDTQHDILPEKVITIDTLGVYSFFNPVVIGDNVFWGCYNTEAGGSPTIVKLNKKNLSWEALKYDNPGKLINANYTYALRNLNNVLYISTESGYILKYDLQSQSFISEVIDLTGYGTQHIQHLTTDGKGLWAMSTLPAPSLFYVKNPSHKNPEVYKVTSKYPIAFSRIYCDDSQGYLYGQGYKIKYMGGGKFNYENIKYLNYENLRVIIGGFQERGKHYLFAENIHKKSLDIDKKEFRMISLPPSGPPEIIEVQDIKAKDTGAILISIGSDQINTLYTSTYWIGYLYKVKADFKERPQFLVDNQGVRLHEQADIIRSYPGRLGSMLFGFYQGSNNSAVLNFLNPTLPKGRMWAKKYLPRSDGKLLPRITSIAFDESENLFIGTGEMTINATTPPAAIFFMRKEALLNRFDDKVEREIEYNWPKNYPLDRPIRFMSLSYYEDYIYCISYHIYKNTIPNRFFRINVKTGAVEISPIHNAYFHGFRDRLLLREDKYLMVGFASKLYRYDLTKFDFTKPLQIYDFSDTSEGIKMIVGNGRHYFICLERKIAILDKQLKLVRYLATLSEADSFQSIDILKTHLFAVTKNGLMIKYDISSL